MTNKRCKSRIPIQFSASYCTEEFDLAKQLFVFCKPWGGYWESYVFLWVLWAFFHSCFSLEEEIHTHVLDLFCLYPSFCKIVDSIRPSFCDFVAPYLASKDLNRSFPELGLHQIYFFFLGWESVSNETIGQSQWGLQNQEGQPWQHVFWF